MLVTRPIAAAAAFSFSSEMVGDGDCACGDCCSGRACGGLIWAFAAGVMIRPETISAAAARGCNRRTLIAWCSVQCMRYLRSVLWPPAIRADCRSRLMARGKYDARRRKGYPVTLLTHRRRIPPATDPVPLVDRYPQNVRFETLPSRGRLTPRIPSSEFSIGRDGQEMC